MRTIPKNTKHSYGIEVECDLCIATIVQGTYGHVEYLHVEYLTDYLTIVDKKYGSRIFGLQGDAKYISPHEGTYNVLELVSEPRTTDPKNLMLTSCLSAYFTYMNTQTEKQSIIIFKRGDVHKLNDMCSLYVNKDCVIWYSNKMHGGPSTATISPVEMTGLATQITLGLLEDNYTAYNIPTNTCPNTILKSLYNYWVGVCYPEKRYADDVDNYSILFKNELEPYTAAAYNLFCAYFSKMEGVAKFQRDFDLFWSATEFSRFYIAQTLLPAPTYISMGNKAYMRIMLRTSLGSVIFNPFTICTTTKLAGLGNWVSALTAYIMEGFQLNTLIPFETLGYSDIMGHPGRKADLNVLGMGQDSSMSYVVPTTEFHTVVTLSTLIKSILGNTNNEHIASFNQWFETLPAREAMSYNLKTTNPQATDDQITMCINLANTMIKSYDWISPPPISLWSDPMGYYTRAEMTDQQYVMEIRTTRLPREYTQSYINDLNKSLCNSWDILTGIL